MNFPIGVRTALKMTGRSIMIAPSGFVGRKYKYKRCAKPGQFAGGARLVASRGAQRG
jgi:hypothetical protein